MKILLLEFKGDGHGREHALALAEDLRLFAQVELLFPDRVWSFAEIDECCSRNRCDFVIIATLDYYFLKILLKSRGRIAICSVLGVYHNLPSLTRWVNCAVWTLACICGYLDGVFVYSKPSKGPIKCYLESIKTPWVIPHPLGVLNNPQPSHDGCVLFLGMITKEKGASWLRYIAAQLPVNCYLRISGRAPSDSDRSRLKEELGEFLDRGLVLWDERYITEEEKKVLIAGCLCLITPYSAEHGRASGVAVDAIRSGIPLLYSAEHSWTRKYTEAVRYTAAIEVNSWMDANKAFSDVLRIRASSNVFTKPKNFFHPLMRYLSVLGERRIV